MEGSCFENLAPFFNTFINLPQPAQTPCGYPNHWHFSFQPYPGPRNVSVLFIANPYARIGHSAGILDFTRWLDVTSVEAMSELWLILLLRAFARPHVGSMRPWSWSTNSTFMVDQITRALRHYSVAGWLPMVTVSAEMERLASRMWRTDFWLLASGHPLRRAGEV